MQMKQSTFWLLVAVFTFFTLKTAVAEPLSIDLAENQVNITSGFTGSHLVLFGTKTKKGEVVIVLEGPAVDLKVRQKRRVLGAWVNRSASVFENIPSYYDYALSVQDEKGLLSKGFLIEKRIGLSALKPEPRKAKKDKELTKKFQDALIRNKQAQNFYPNKPQPVKFISENLFRIDFYLPANIPSGEYTVRGLLIDDGQVQYEQIKKLHIGLTGFNSGVYQFSLNYSFLYGVLCVFLACMAGWLSNAITRRN